jgi:hypothetical protein
MKNSQGKGFWGWLGRQVGHVKKAVETDPAGPKTIYRDNRVQEQQIPNQPGVTLRRTVIDEVIVDPKKKIGQGKKIEN